ncbi:MAG TPA: enoyl-CoA hydratase/isomerase family protein [Candidatus Dormibacteraeota bacterium]|nr:enoyl-CoA hydratase/isomerase family protein [Candidatus Dormibacteraeota bacterium]
MDYKSILVEKRDRVGIITLNRPPENRLVLQMLQEIMNATADFDADENISLIMVKAAGRDFSRGGDVQALLDLKDWEANQFFMTLIDTVKAFRRATKPIMAVVHGWATAAGMVIALGCDLVVASEDASFGATAINFGLFCFFGPPTLLPPLIGPKKAFELGVTGDLLSAREADQRGMVNLVVPREKLDEEAWKLADKIVSKSPTAILLGKRCFYACQDMESQKALDHGASVMIQYQMTEEAREGMRAFLENRKPQWAVAGTRSDLSVKRKKQLGELVAK